ncbi:hypothetical protein B0H19DRAFT_1266678 [Mycena capillaripes]|nr:hypothetical protein B0H19DRAFT_1266678 [Mycena capillaripes]
MRPPSQSFANTTLKMESHARASLFRPVSLLVESGLDAKDRVRRGSAALGLRSAVRICTNADLLEEMLFVEEHIAVAHPEATWHAETIHRLFCALVELACRPSNRCRLSSPGGPRRDSAPRIFLLQFQADDGLSWIARHRTLFVDICVSFFRPISSYIPPAHHTAAVGSKTGLSLAEWRGAARRLSAVSHDAAEARRPTTSDWPSTPEIDGSRHLLCLGDLDQRRLRKWSRLAGYSPRIAIGSMRLNF